MTNLDPKDRRVIDADTDEMDGRQGKGDNPNGRGGNGRGYGQCAGNGQGRRRRRRANACPNAMTRKTQP